MKRFILCFLVLLMLGLTTSCSGRDNNLTTSLKDNGQSVEPSSKNHPTEQTTTIVTFPPESTAPIKPPFTTNPDSQQAGVSDKKYHSVRGKESSAAKTITGYELLPEVTLNVNDPNNSQNLPTKKIEFSYGVAKNGLPHEQTLKNQAFFDSKGFDALAYDKVSSQKVLYLTFDCGWENGYTSKVLDVLKEKNIHAAFFCTLDHVKAEPDLICRMIKEGHIVGNHSTKHPSFAEISRTRMAAEIQTCDNYLRTNFGYSAPFFRFPKGDYSESALDLVESLGYKSIFWSVAYADWDVKNLKGPQYAFETVTARIHPGAVILLHSVSPDNAQSLGKIIDWAKAQGYEFKSLED